MTAVEVEAALGVSSAEAAGATSAPTVGPSAAVRTRDLCKVFGTERMRVEALHGVDLELKSGEFLAVMGPSGSGKSTLLHLVGGLDTPTSGSVLLQGQDLAVLDDDALTLVRRRKIGFVFQFFNLLPVLSAEENVALPLVIDGVKESEANRRARRRARAGRRRSSARSPSSRALWG